MDIRRSRSPERSNRSPERRESGCSLVIEGTLGEVAVAALAVGGAEQYRGKSRLTSPEMPRVGDVLRRHVGKGILGIDISATVTAADTTSIDVRLHPFALWRFETTGSMRYDPDTGETRMAVDAPVKPPTDLLKRFGVNTAPGSFEQDLVAEIERNRVQEAVLNLNENIAS